MSPSLRGLDVSMYMKKPEKHTNTHTVLTHGNTVTEQRVEAPAVTHVISRLTLKQWSGTLLYIYCRYSILYIYIYIYILVLSND